MTFGEQVLQVRAQLGMSQDKFARELDISHATINFWEKGKSSPQKRYQRLFERFCREHGISLPVTVKSGIKTLYLNADEMPQSCVACPLTDEYSDLPNIRCQITDDIINGSEDTLNARLSSCPLRVLKK